MVLGAGQDDAMEGHDGAWEAKGHGVGEGCAGARCRAGWCWVVHEARKGHLLGPGVTQLHTLGEALWGP